MTATYWQTLDIATSECHRLHLYNLTMAGLSPRAEMHQFSLFCFASAKRFFLKGMDFEEKKQGAERYGIENKYKSKLFR